MNKPKRNFLIVLAVTVFLTSCETIYLNVELPNIPVRDLLLGGDSESEEYKVHGYLLLSSKPEDDLQRYLKICESYLRHFDAAEDFKGEVSDRNLMPTYWLLNSDAITISKTLGHQYLYHMSCDEYIELYDYSRAKILLSKASQLSTRGPILAAWSTQDVSSEILIFDLSNLDENDSDRAMLIWKERITMNPRVWNNGFKLVKIREELRSFLQKYGDEIVSVISS